MAVVRLVAKRLCICAGHGLFIPLEVPVTDDRIFGEHHGAVEQGFHDQNAGPDHFRPDNGGHDEGDEFAL
jgi:hypothetical protein